MSIAAISSNHFAEAGIPQSLGQSTDVWQQVAQQDVDFRSVRGFVPGLLKSWRVPSQAVDVNRLVASALEFRNNNILRQRVSKGVRQSFENVIRLLAVQMPLMRPASSASAPSAVRFRAIYQQQQGTNQLQQESQNLINAGGYVAAVGGIGQAMATAGSTAAYVAGGVAMAGCGLILVGAIGLGIAYWLSH